MLFVIGFVGIYRKQRPHEGPHKKSLWFCDGYHEKPLFSEWGFVMCGVRSTHNVLNTAPLSLILHHQPGKLGKNRTLAAFAAPEHIQGKAIEVNAS